MSSHGFVTVDVFAERRFAGNQLAVFPDAAGIPEDALQAIAREFRFSETTFVLPPESGGDARVRIFTLDGEAAFAGHPLVGTAVVLADRFGKDELALEVPAGVCPVTVRGTAPTGRSATVTTPQPFAVDRTIPAPLVASALGVSDDGMVTLNHEPTACGMGRPFVVAEMTLPALTDAAPDAPAFARAREELHSERFAVLAYARRGCGEVETRMFSPLTGTVEDAATGSANVALVGLLLANEPDRTELVLTSRQGVRMGRPSTLHLRAWRTDDGIQASVGGDVVVVTTGELTL